jgi:hypothetical protein
MKHARLVGEARNGGTQNDQHGIDHDQWPISDAGGQRLDETCDQGQDRGDNDDLLPDRVCQRRLCTMHDVDVHVRELITSNGEEELGDAALYAGRSAFPRVRG